MNIQWNKSVAPLISLVLVVAILSCSSGDFAGGTSTETTNGILILTSTGKPAAGAFVSVVDGSGWIDSISGKRSPVQEELTANNFGRVWVESTKGTRTVRVKFGDQSAIFSGDRDTIFLTKSVPLGGKANGSDSVRIGGTDLVVPVLGDGSYRFESVPSGMVTLFRETAFGVQNGIAVSTTNTSSHDLISGNSSLLFDDFSGGFDLNPVTPVSGGVRWYTFSDSIHKSYRNGFWQIDSFSSHDGNSSISARTTSGIAVQELMLGSGETYPYAGLGAHLGTSKRGFNLSNLTAVNVRMSGSGTVRIRLTSQQLLSRGISGYSAIVPVSGDMKSVQIPIQSFHLDVKDSTNEKLYPWKNGASDIRRIEFFCRGTENTINSVIRFEIDEIWFEGVKLPL